MGDTRTTSEPSIDPPIKTKPTAIAAPVGVSDSVWADFQILRKAKRSPITTTAVAGIESEALKAGLSLEAVLSECCARGWVGFKAEWLAASSPRASPAQTRDEKRAHTIAVLTGKISHDNRQQPAPERDITADSYRVA